MTRLTLPDAEALHDLVTYTRRAQVLVPTGSVRLVAAGQALACYAGILDGSGLLGSGAVIGLRVLALDQPAAVDVTMTTTRLLAELATVDQNTQAIDLTGDPMPPRWVAQAPPRSGWEPVGLLARDDVVAASKAKDPAAQSDSLPDGLTNAVAIGLRGLGLLPDGVDPALYRSGSWRRLSTPAGHVLIRP